MFHLLDVTLWNAYIRQRSDKKQTFTQFREKVVKHYLGISQINNDDRNLVHTGPTRGGEKEMQ